MQQDTNAGENVIKNYLTLTGKGFSVGLSLKLSKYTYANY